MHDLTALYCLIDDFCQEFEPILNAQLLANGEKKRLRANCVSLSELMTLVVLFHQVRYRQFKSFYLIHVRQHLKHEFPTMPTYSRCIALMPRALLALSVLFEQLKGACTGLSIVDSTPVAVCDNLRIKRHRVFKGLAERGKSSTGWFFGFKLHVVINHLGEIVSACLTPGNVNDRQPLPELLKGAFGKLYADKGYLSKALTEQLKSIGIDLVTHVRRNMKPVEHSDFDHALLRRRSLIETVFDELKNLCQIEHSRHRSVLNFAVNLLGGSSLIVLCRSSLLCRFHLHLLCILDLVLSRTEVNCNNSIG